LSALLGEVSLNETRALAQHYEGCVACRSALREDELLLQDLAARPQLAVSEDAFTDRVLAARAALPSEPRPAHASERRRRLVHGAGVLAVAACAAVSLLTLAPRAPRSEVQARGAELSRAQKVSADVLFVRDSVLYPLSNARLQQGDALAVRYTNPGDVPRYLTVFALDAQNELHWVYPAYVDPASNPSSVRLLPEVRGKLLDEVVEPEAPAPGELSVFALITAQPLHVQEIEALRRGLSKERIQAVFSGADVQTWRATWN
jgi:hypothetical protein